MNRLDRLNAIVATDGYFINGDQPTTCPTCGTRTVMEEVPEDTEPGACIHTCKGCGRAFATCDDNEEECDMTYRVFKRSARNFEEFASARKTIVRRGLTREEAQRMCREWNDDRTPQQVARGTKYEFEQE